MNKVALITGATTGIGRQIAITLAKSGYDIALNYRSYNENVETTKNLILKEGVKCLECKGDVSNFLEAVAITKKTIDEYGQIDVLINNAGITKDQLLIRMSKDDFDSVIDTNLNGTFNMVKNVVPHMLKKKTGRIINLASVVGIVGNAGQINYAASKAGIIGLTKSLAKEVASKNILVNAIAPGYIQTKMTDTLKDEVKENIASAIPLKRLGTPEDVANLVKFLASDDSSYITGQVIHVDGGMVM